MQRMPMCLVWPSKYRYLNVGTVVLPVPTTWTSISLSTCGTCHCHSDRMAWLFVQYSANEKFSNFMQNKPSKLPKTFSNFAKVVKFRQIWSRWSLSDHCASATWTCNENIFNIILSKTAQFITCTRFFSKLGTYYVCTAIMLKQKAIVREVIKSQVYDATVKVPAWPYACKCNSYYVIVLGR